MKTLQVVNETQSSISKVVNFSPIFCKMIEQLEFFEKVFRVHPTKRENAFGKLNHVSFVTRAVTGYTNFQVVFVNFAKKRIGKPNFHCPLLSKSWVENVNYVPRK